MHLKAQYAKVKSDMAALIEIDTRTNHSKPTASIEVEALGSRLAPWLVLATGQSSYVEELVLLTGVMPIAFGLHYVSQSTQSTSDYKGFFGTDRASSYEKRFTHVGKSVYHLDLPCGRVFAFAKQKDDSFKDEGSLGVSIEAIDANRFALHYHEGNSEYYSHGYLVGVKDTNGNILTLEYAQGPTLTRISNAFGASLDFGYNSKGLVSSMSDHSGRSWRFSYGNHDELLSIHFEDKHLVSYGYVSTLEEDREVRLLSQVYSASHQEQLSLTYDETRKLKHYTQAGVTYSYSYEDARTIRKEDAYAKVSRYRLDSMGLIASMTYPDATMEVEKYDEGNHTATIQTRGGNERVEVYDHRARLLSVRMNGSIVLAYSYEGDNPYPVSLIKEGKTLYYGYDEAYNLLSITYPDQTSQSYTYTQEGQVKSTIDALGASTHYSYNDKDQLIAIEAPNGSKTHFSYDALGRVLSQENTLGHTHTYSYNSQDQVIHYTDSDGKEIAFAYTPEGKLHTLTDPANRVTKYSYNTHERLTQKRYPDGSKEQYTYDKDATLKSIQRVDGSTLYFSYDTNQNITQVLAKDTEGNEEVMHYDYDALSNLLHASTLSHTLDLKYNEKASITTEIQNEFKLHKTYLPNNKQRQSLGILDTWIHYSYDGADNISSITQQNKEIKLRYDANHLPSKRVYPNKHKEQMVYDAGSNLIALKSQNHIDYSYNDAGKLITKENKEEGIKTTYSYSPSGALLEATSTPSTGSGTDLVAEQSRSTVTQFSYNAAGNQIQNDQDYNSLNQLIEDREYLYAYDKRGNLQEKLHKQTQTRSIYVFNLFDQLQKVKTVDKDKNLIEGFKFSYDALNRRVIKTSYTQENLPHGTTQHYLYDNENIVAILDENKTLLVTIIHDANTDTPLSITTHQNEAKPLDDYETHTLYTNLSEEEKLHIYKGRQKRTYYYHRDHQGSITALTNEAGDIVESFLYDEAYGTILDHHKTEETYNPYCYTGREFDSHDLYYYRARYYDPSVGRFISSDPIEFLAGDFNFYRYVGGDPVNFVDPTGLIIAMDNHATMSPDQMKGIYPKTAGACGQDKSIGSHMEDLGDGLVSLAKSAHTVGDWLARRIGFRDWQAGNSIPVNQIKAKLEWAGIKYASKNKKMEIAEGLAKDMCERPMYYVGGLLVPGGAMKVGNVSKKVSYTTTAAATKTKVTGAGIEKAQETIEEQLKNISIILK